MSATSVSRSRKVPWKTWSLAESWRPRPRCRKAESPLRPSRFQMNPEAPSNSPPAECTVKKVTWVGEGVRSGEMQHAAGELLIAVERSENGSLDPVRKRAVGFGHHGVGLGVEAQPHRAHEEPEAVQGGAVEDVVEIGDDLVGGLRRLQAGPDHGHLLRFPHRILDRGGGNTGDVAGVLHPDAPGHLGEVVDQLDPHQGQGEGGHDQAGRDHDEQGAIAGSSHQNFTGCAS